MTEYPPGYPTPGHPPPYPPHGQSDHAPPPYALSDHAVPPYEGPPQGYPAPPYEQPPYGYPAPPYGQTPYGQPPYGTYEGGAPYGQYPPAAGWYPYHQPPAQRRLDGWSVAGLVCGILPTVLFGLIFSVVGLVRTANPLRRGRALAVAGLVLSVAWFAGFLALGFLADDTQPTAAPGVAVNVLDLAVGDCFQQPPLTGQTAVTTMQKVACTQSHNAQIVATVEPPDTNYPGTSALLDQSVTLCHTEAVNYLGRSLGRLRVAAFAPHQALWEAGHKTSSCVLFDPDHNFQGDIRTDR